MAIIVNNPYSKPSPISVSSTTFSTSYTVPSGARSLYVFISVDNGNSSVPLPTICRYNGINLTLVAQIPVDAANNGQLSFLYRLINPPSGSFNLETSNAAAPFWTSAFSVSSGNNLVETIGSVAYATSTIPSVSIASASGNLTVFGLTVNNVADTAISETGGQSVLSEGGNAANSMHQLSSELSTGATNSATWTISGGAQRWSAIAINIAEDTAAVTSINGGNPVTVGQSNVVIAHTGFTGAVTSVTTNRSGVTCAITAGDASSTTVTVSGWVEGGAYPVVDNTVTFTCTRGAESASATQTLTKPANYAQVAFSGAIIDDQNLIGYHLNAAGHTVNGGTFYYRTNQVSTLTVNADTSWTCDPAGGTFSATFIPSSGATSGNAYLFDITLLNGSIVSVKGLTSVGLTSTGLTQIGLTSVGLC